MTGFVILKVYEGLALKTQLKRKRIAKYPKQEAMKEANVLHMNSGDGEWSYASNSSYQETVIRKAQPVVNKTIRGMADLDGFPQCFSIADLGCSSGPNALLAISNIIDKVRQICEEKNHKVPQFQVCLNDLFGNDFNTIFKSLPAFYAKQKRGENFGPCFISAVPGSFYERLFPDKSIHLVHSSNSIHWLSQVPKGLEDNKQHIYMADTSPPNVFEAYRKQFQKDFILFLKLRSQEIIRGGRMVLTFMGRSIADPTSPDGCHLWELLAKSLVDMVKEGLVPESKMNSFNIPHYTPYVDEVRDAIENEGSFSLDNVKLFEVNFVQDDAYHPNMIIIDEANRCKMTAKGTRAVMEPMMVAHFGDTIMDIVFTKYEKYLEQEEKVNFNITISMTKK